MKKLLLVCLLISVNLYAVKEKFEVYAKYNDNLASNYNVQSINKDHPCGSVAEFSVHELIKKGILSNENFDKVIEYSNNTILNKWYIPIESYVVGIRSDELTVSYSSFALKIDTKGKVRKISKPLYEFKQTQCPMILEQEYENLSLVRCQEFKDQKTKKPRYIAYQGSCI